MKKNFLVGLFAIVLCFVLTGCGFVDSDESFTGERLSKSYTLEFSEIDTILVDAKTALENIFKNFSPMEISTGGEFRMDIDDYPDNLHSYNVTDGNNVTKGTFTAFYFTGINKSKTNLSFKVDIEDVFENVTKGDTYTITSNGNSKINLSGEGTGKSVFDEEKGILTITLETLSLSGTTEQTTQKTTTTDSGDTNKGNEVKNNWDISNKYDNVKIVFKVK